MQTTDFEHIRPFTDEELPAVYEELIADEHFAEVMTSLFPMSFEDISTRMRMCKTVRDFQEAFCYPLLRAIARTHSTGLTMHISPELNRNTCYTYVSNHRDIILDSGFLSILLVENELDTVEIAIGDNLLIYPWIRNIVRINKSFIVQRSPGLRQMLQASTRLSQYMHHVINEKKQSIWIAQRQGRAKDADDRTQDSILKMFAMSGEGSHIDRIRTLNIAPLSISYEYDPCDYLKAQEMQQVRDNPHYEKSQRDDLNNMKTGLFGFKGKVHFEITPCINHQLDELQKRNVPRIDLFNRISAITERAIHTNYRIYPNNYIAHDLLSGECVFADRYTDVERVQFNTYLDQQLSKIQLPNKDSAFLRERMLEMYANPLINKIKADVA